MMLGLDIIMIYNDGRVMGLGLGFWFWGFCGSVGRFGAFFVCCHNDEKR